jgi:para-nitrobenzyl esterase
MGGSMSTRVKIASGELEGREKNGVLLFAGIPYAAPPIGERRFLPPEPHPGWQGVRDAKRFGPAAPQRPGEGLTAAPLRWDEDCLTLNVATPCADDSARPVLVWIHGGGFRTGKGGIPWYDGHSFAERGDVVTVTINYRLGPLGFAHLPEFGGDAYASSGLNGILDQIAALRWVRDNIAAFGGDPEQVTIAGESAGGMSVGTLLGIPSAQGLFRAAIPQSGAAHHTIDEELALGVARRFAEELGAHSLADLQAATADEILDAQARAESHFARSNQGGLGGMIFRPVVEARALPQKPIDAIAAGSARDVRILVGSNQHETTLFGAMLSDDPARVEQVANRIFGDASGLERYRKAHPGASTRDLMIALTTDQMFRIPAVRLAEAQATAGGQVWKYRFTWESRAFGGKLGATHALEVPFAFNTLTRPGVDVFLGDGPIPQGLADTMHAVWTRFVRDGDPRAEGIPEWPSYLPGRRVMEFGDRVGLLEDPDRATREAWHDRL